MQQILVRLRLLKAGGNEWELVVGATTVHMTTDGVRGMLRDVKAIPVVTGSSVVVRVSGRNGGLCRVTFDSAQFARFKDYLSMFNDLIEGEDQSK